ncbi:DUF1349 domain-containing protein [Demequina phytophila]|uniref:DUF1349 domain-containing protein n=1 Tax=Demequina phytophila TaxID=1638981 RepID=UPI00078440CD|nr:DUF1349 domain-containing protein [Demequina phytophila]
MDLATLLETGTWTTPPVGATVSDGALDVEAREGSDAWRVTSYGFIHDDAHALVVPLENGTAIEVSWLLDYGAQFDQGGVMLRVDAESWIKAGVEFSDGEPQVGAVVTRGVSDWSVAPVPEWAGREVTVRASRSGDAVTLRARAGDEPWRLIRVAPLDPDAVVLAGPFCAAPTRPGLTVRFTSVRLGPADASLHPED